MTTSDVFAGQRGLRERARLEWWVRDGGDPAAVLEDFLADHGLPVRDLSSAGPGWTGNAACAAVHLSADASALLAGGSVGKPTPAPAIPDVVAIVTDGQPCTESDDARTPWRLGSWRPSWTPDDHADAVRAVLSAIAEGDVYQVNVVGHASAPYTGDPGMALARVAALPGARYPIVLSGSEWALGCASPETLVSISGGRVVTKPIKGTRPATDAGRLELLASPKERAEHIMIVDLSRNDLARIARTGSVRVDELYAIRRWSHLWQAESVVSAQLEEGTGLADVLRALCPGGSITGAPKLAALEQIAALEPVGRGPSMGALGWIGPSGVDLGLTIRTVAVDRERVHVWAGGGITWSSDPAAEVAEAAAKAGPIKAALAGSVGSALVDLAE
ncbi:MAG TPA: chorismate-binding protein [Micromonosporaceae bacterium]